MLCGFVCLKKESYHYLRGTWLNPYLFNANLSNFYADPLVLCNTLQSFPHIVSIITILGLVALILSHSYLSTPGEDTSVLKVTANRWYSCQSWPCWGGCSLRRVVRRAGVWRLPRNTTWSCSIPLLPAARLLPGCPTVKLLFQHLVDTHVSISSHAGAKNVKKVEIFPSVIWQRQVFLICVWPFYVLEEFSDYPDKDQAKTTIMCVVRFKKGAHRTSSSTPIRFLPFCELDQNKTWVLLSRNSDGQDYTIDRNVMGFNTFDKMQANNTEEESLLKTRRWPQMQEISYS